MKSMTKRISVLLLAICMIVSLALPAFAANQPSATEIITTASGYTSASDVTYPSSGYIANWGARGEVAKFISAKAADYYTSTYEELSALAGSDDNTAKGTALYNALNTMAVSQQKTLTTYDGLRDLYGYTDCVLGDTTKLSLFYMGNLVDSTWDGGTTYNREHTWPKSKLTNEQSNDGADIMQIRPSDPSCNSSRGNTAYGESSNYYDPGVSVRGDVARIVLYMYVRWGNENTLWGTTGVFESLDVLLKWNAADPVDTWEMGRNDSIQSITGARNMFVDYPELAYDLFNKEVPADLVTPSSFSADSGDSGDTPEITGSKAILVTDMADLSIGDKIIITAATKNYAMGAQNGYYRNRVDISKGEGYAIYDTTAQVITLGNGAVGGTYSLGVDGGYLYASSSDNNNLQTETTLTANSSWKISIADGKTTIQAVGPNSRNVMQHNDSSPRFACYSTASMEAVSIYVIEEDANAACAHSYTSQVVAPTCTVEGYTKYTCSACGNFYYDAYTEKAEHTYVNGACSACGEDEPAANGWVEIDPYEIAASDIIAITITKSDGKTYVLPNKTVSKAPAATLVTIENGALITEDVDSVSWNVTVSGSNLVIYVAGSTTNRLTSKADNNGVGVGTGTNYTWTIDGGYLKNTGTNRYLCVYNAQDWRNYTTSTTTNAANQTLKFWKLTAPSDEEEICEHTYDDGVVTAPTCTVDGFTTYTCTKCGESYNDNVVAKLGHQNEEVSRVEPTCTEAGESKVVCTVCGSPYTFTIPATGHTYENGACTGCGEKEPAAGSEYTISFATKDQRTTYTTSQQIWENGNFVLTNNKGKSTSNVGDYSNPARFYKSSTLIFACENMEKLVVVCNNATYTTAFVNSFTAGTNETVTVDGTTVTIEFATPVDSFEVVLSGGQTRFNSATAYVAGSGSDEHVCEYEAVVTAPTCTTAGYTTYTCSCGDSYVADEVAALGHNYNAVVTAPTCTAAGYTTYTCSACGDTYVADEVAALGHNYNAVVTAPTCTTAGYTTYTCSCGDTYVADEVDALGHASVTYSYVNNVHTFTCDVCGEVAFTKTEGKKFAINSAAPVLADDIVMKYNVTIPAGFEKAYMVFEFNGETYTVYDAEYDASTGRYAFKFPGINPQKMGDNICATVYAYVEGYEVSAQIASYSMVKYCDNQLKKATLPAETRTMLSDVLAYGEAAQIVQNYKTDALVTSLLSAESTLTPSTFPAELDPAMNIMARTGVADSRVQFTAATLSLGSKMAVRVSVTCTDLDAFTYKVEISGREYTYTGEDLVPVTDGSDGKYYLYFNQMKASELGQKITVTCWEGDTQVSYTIEYSVYTYVYRNYNKGDVAIQNLLKAIYNYGESVKNA